MDSRPAHRTVRLVGASALSRILLNRRATAIDPVDKTAESALEPAGSATSNDATPGAPLGPRLSRTRY